MCIYITNYIYIYIHINIYIYICIYIYIHIYIYIYILYLYIYTHMMCTEFYFLHGYTHMYLYNIYIYIHFDRRWHWAWECRWHPRHWPRWWWWLWRGMHGARVSWPQRMVICGVKLRWFRWRLGQWHWPPHHTWRCEGTYGQTRTPQAARSSRISRACKERSDYTAKWLHVGCAPRRTVGCASVKLCKIINIYKAYIYI